MESAVGRVSSIKHVGGALGKQTLLGISKRGDKELRSLLVHGARAVASAAHKHNDRLSRWVCRLIEQKGMNKATIALANKLARIAWVITTTGVDYKAQPVSG